MSVAALSVTSSIVLSNYHVSVQESTLGMSRHVGTLRSIGIISIYAHCNARHAQAYHAAWSSEQPEGRRDSREIAIGAWPRAEVTVRLCVYYDAC